MKSRPLLSFLALAVAAVSSALAAEVPSTPTDTLDRIEGQALAARQDGQAERLAELREELRQLPVPAAEAVRASRIWASLRSDVAPTTAKIAGKLDPEDNIKGPGTVWSLELELDHGGGSSKTGNYWTLDTSILSAGSLDPSQTIPPVKGNYWSLDTSILPATSLDPGDPPIGKGSYWNLDLSISTNDDEPPTDPSKTGYWDPEGFELAPRSEHP